MKQLRTIALLALFIASGLILLATGTVILAQDGVQPAERIISEYYTLASGETINNDLVVVAQTITLEPETTITGDVALVGEEVILQGTITGNLTAPMTRTSASPPSESGSDKSWAGRPPSWPRPTPASSAATPWWSTAPTGNDAPSPIPRSRPCATRWVWAPSTPATEARLPAPGRSGPAQLCRPDGGDEYSNRPAATMPPPLICSAAPVSGVAPGAMGMLTKEPS